MYAYMPNAHEIIPGIWLGNRAAAHDTAFLRSNNISVVFNCTKDVPFSPAILRQYRVPVHDNLDPVEIKNMERMAPEIVYKLVSEYRSGRRILVHCMAGMQRSAAVVAMLLIAYTGKTADEIMAYIRMKRLVAFQPSANFAPAIRGFEREWRSRLSK